jgi:tetratricopeptide (TPR) repeat protein
MFHITSGTGFRLQALAMNKPFRPVYPEALNNLGILYLRTERRNDAVASFEECIRVAADFDQPYLNLARVYSAEGSPAKARTVLVDLLKQHPDHAQAQNMLAQLPQLGCKNSRLILSWGLRAQKIYEHFVKPVKIEIILHFYRLHPTLRFIPVRPVKSVAVAGAAV